MRLGRSIALAALMLTMLGGPLAAQERQRPVLFVPGNGDSAAVWYPTIWRFESNGWDPALLSAVEFANPTARGRDDTPQENRSSSGQQAGELAAAVTRALIESKQEKVVLVGLSRGGNAIRNYIRNGGGKATVATAILGGTPNHGVYAWPENPLNEFNGAGPFLKGLNEGSEVVPGVAFVTLRSDKNDKYAQPTGEFVGAPGKPTGVDSEGPALAGATNIVLPGLDHREVALHRLAFREMWRALTGGEPKSLDIVPEAQPVLTGIVSGSVNGAPTNLPLPGATVEVYEVDPATGERRGDARHKKTIGADGLWGPFSASPTAYYEFVATAPGYPVIHTYRTPFPRSSRYIHLRLQPLEAKEKAAGAVVTMTRPRGYLGHGRDTFTLDGAVPDGVNTGLAGTSTATKLYSDATSRAVPVVLNEERMTVRTWPAGDNHVVFAEFHY